ncbi:YceI family protein [Neisseria shayeganii]|uniref:Polyisoprenoid-binding protein n=1 Tax=Neisseria shayeganii TaxID=607712 RepID=A0A7D7NA48_9NEIS|nr:YceI family protein [Neisseria shayeganii]QMT40997.1 polyisoprenoid-binding protein [Neisseria shayeganii]
MKKTLFALTLAAVAATAVAADYRIDPHHTNARFAIDHFGTSTNVGGFYGLTGAMKFDPARRTGSIDITIPVAKLQSSSPEFTNHLKSADLFHAERHPEMRFVSTRFNFAGNKVHSVEGRLTLLGKTHPVTLRAEKFNCYDNPILKARVCGGDFSATIDRTLWGMNYLLEAGIPKNVRLDIQIEAAKQ